MKELTPKQYAAKLNAMNAELAKGMWIEKAAKDTMSVSDKRIFSQGKDSTGGKIGSYSVKPIYISGDDAPRAVNHKGKTGKKIKGGYYKGGYKQFRKQQGRESKFVNLRLTGELRSDYDNSDAGPTPIKVNNLTYKVTLNKPINIKKKQGAEDKYGLIFPLTKKEDTLFSKSMDFHYEQVVKRHLGR